MTEPLLCAEELSRLLSVKPRTIYEWARMNYIPNIRLGTLVRFERKAVEKWLAARSKEGRAKRVPEL